MARIIQTGVGDSDVYNPAGLADTLGLPLDAIEGEVESGRLKSVRFGAAALIRGTWVKQWLDSLAYEAKEEVPE